MIRVVPDARSKRKPDLAENPLGSLPAQMHTWNETKALYRLLDEPDVTFGALMQPHFQQTREQANASAVVLLVQDTTDIDLSHRHKISFVQTNRQRTRRGIFRVNGACRADARHERCLDAWRRPPFVRI